MNFFFQGLNQRGQRRILVNAENIAAVLCPRSARPPSRTGSLLRATRGKLPSQHFVGEEPGVGYRFDGPEEQERLQQSVDRQPVSEPKLRELLDGLIRRELERLGPTGLGVRGGHKLYVAETVN